MQSDQQHDSETIRGHMARGAMWMVSMRWSLKAIGLVNVLIIARLLTPEDFGLIAMAMIVMGFLQVIGDVSVDIALLRNPDAAREDYDSAWTLQIISGLLVMVALWAIAPIAAFYYGDDRVELVIQIVSVQAAIMGFENVGVIEFRKTLNFSMEFRYWVYRRLILFVFALGLVLALRNYLALALSMPLSALITVLVSYSMSPYRPRPNLSKIKDVWSVSRWLILANAARFVGQRVDEFVVGGISGTAEMGHYNIAASVSTTPTRELIGPADRVLMPTYAKLLHDPAEMRSALRNVLGIVSIVSLSVGVGMSAIAEDFVLVVLGDQWAEAVPFFRWLAIFGALEGLAVCLLPYYLAGGGERSVAVAYIIYACVLVPVVVIAGYSQGILAIAISRTGVTLIAILCILYMMVRVGTLTAEQVVTAMWRPLVASIVMGLGVVYLHDAQITPRLLSLVHDVTIGIVVFPAVIYGLWFLAGRPDGPERTVLKVCSGWIGR